MLNSNPTTANVCYDKSKDTGLYTLSVILHGQILQIDIDAATKFRVGVMNEDWSTAKQVNYTLETLGKNKELFLKEFGGFLKDTKDRTLVFTALLRNPQYRDYVLLPIYKQLVSYGEICQSAKLLFQEMKGKSFYDNAIEYTLSTNAIDMNKEYKCGDSELELLLNW